MERYRGDYIYPHIKSHEFIFQRARSFSSSGKLSSLNLVLDDIKTDDEYSNAVTLDRLINIDLEQFDKPEKRPEIMKEHFHRLIKFLKICRGIKLSIEKVSKGKNLLEKDVVYTMAKEIFIPLFGKIKFEKNYCNYILGLPGAEIANLGIGSYKTWHGEAELRIETCDALLMLNPLANELTDTSSGDEESDNEEDPGSNDDQISCCSNDQSIQSVNSTTNLEGKKQMSLKENMSQLVGTCVVSAFIEKNNDSTLTSPVPTILFNKHTFVICLYEVNFDILMVSTPRQLFNPDGGISRTAVLLLWIAVHHR